MKKIVFICCLCSIQSTWAQIAKPFPSTETDLPCPAGTCPMITFSIEAFNFHKPRTACKLGFGLCIKFDIGVTCASCTGRAFMADNKVTVWGKQLGNIIELHIPAALQHASGFEKIDMRSFQVDDQSINVKTASGIVKTVVGGTYPVVIRDNEFVVNLPLY